MDMDTNLAQYIYLEKQVAETKYGLLQITMRIDNGFIADIVIHQAKRSLFKRTKNGSIEAKEVDQKE